MLGRNTWNHIITWQINSIRYEYLKPYDGVEIVSIRAERLKPYYCEHIISIKNSDEID